ncbi:MAG: thiamine-phosphate pyrophosphorylase [Candidatus Omnitrophota bacterium]
MKSSCPANQKIIRLIDANLNRSKEAARVCEEIMRFVVEDKKLCAAFKRLRHRITKCALSLELDSRTIISARNSEEDIGVKSITSEANRDDVAAIFSANIQRLKEAVRVLEEFSKIINKGAAENFKKLRFDIYALEKKTAFILLSLRNS